jgi:hypothetical protein
LKNGDEALYWGKAYTYGEYGLVPTSRLLWILHEDRDVRPGISANKPWRRNKISLDCV